MESPSVPDDDHTVQASPELLLQPTSDADDVWTDEESYDTSIQNSQHTRRRQAKNYESIPMGDGGTSSTTTIAVSTEISEHRELAQEAYQPLGKLATFKLWLLEFVALAISMSSFIAIVILLAMYNNEVQPGFVKHISINTLIAIFSTIMRATLLFILSEVIGQLKWRWMDSARPLRDIEYFINAGTGPWGSLKFLFNRKPTLTTVGAIIVIASSAIGPFSQQASATYSCNRKVEGTAAILVARNVTSLGSTSGMLGVAANGLMYGGATNSLTTSQLFMCPAEICTFRAVDGITHSSVGICNVCVPAATALESSRGNSTNNRLADQKFKTAFLRPLHSGPDGAVLQVSTDIQKSPSLNTSDNELEPSVDGPFAPNVTIYARMLSMNVCSGSPQIFDDFRSGGSHGSGEFRSGADCRQHPKEYHRNGPDHAYMGALAVSCTMFACIQNYNGNVVNGSLDESLVSSLPLPLVSKITYEGGRPAKNISELIQFIEPCPLADGRYDSSNISRAFSTRNRLVDEDWIFLRLNGTINLYPTKCMRRMRPGLQGSIQKIIADLNTGHCSLTLSEDQESSIDCGGQWWLDSVYKEGNASLDSITTAFDGMAMAMTNQIRAIGLDGKGTRHAIVSGSSSQPTICVKAYWPWLVYPGSLLALTSAVLVVTYAQSSLNSPRQPVWKSTPLPLIFYNIRMRRAGSDVSKYDSNKEVPLLHLDELEAVAEKAMVRFESDNKAPAFVAEKSEGGLAQLIMECKLELARKKITGGGEHALPPGPGEGKVRLRKRQMTGEALRN